MDNDRDKQQDDDSRLPNWVVMVFFFAALALAAFVLFLAICWMQWEH